VRLCRESELIDLTSFPVGEDLMKEQTRWTLLIPITLEPSDVVPGGKSREKEVQKARELSVPPADYSYGM